MVIKCITSKYGNFTKDKIYKYEVQQINTRTKKPIIVKIIDDEGDSYPINLDNYNRKIFEIDVSFLEFAKRMRNKNREFLNEWGNE